MLLRALVYRAEMVVWAELFECRDERRCLCCETHKASFFSQNLFVQGLHSPSHGAWRERKSHQVADGCGHSSQRIQQPILPHRALITIHSLRGGRVSCIIAPL